MIVNPPIPEPIKTPVRSANSGVIVKSGLLHRTFRGRDRIVDEGVHFLDVFLFKPAERIEVFDFGGNLGGKLRGIKTGDRCNAAASFAKAFPRFFGPCSQRGNQSHAGDNNSSLLQITTSLAKLCGPNRKTAVCSTTSEYAPRYI